MGLDIVWCQWPHIEGLEPGPKLRPGLVRSLARNPDSYDQYAVEVSYGSSVMNKAHFNNLYVTQAEDLRAAGLVRHTRFDLDLTKRLPWSSEFFIVHPLHGNGPIIGHLSARSEKALRTQVRKWV